MLKTAGRYGVCGFLLGILLDAIEIIPGNYGSYSESLFVQGIFIYGFFGAFLGFLVGLAFGKK